MISKSDFLDWKRSTVTEQVLAQCKEEIEALRDKLEDKASTGDTTALAFIAGAIAGLRFIQDIRPEED